MSRTSQAMIVLKACGRKSAAAHFQLAGWTTMIVAHLIKHWMAGRAQSSSALRARSLARSMRVLLFYRAHRRLCQLDLIRHYLAEPLNDDLFHHLSQRDYLIRNLPVRHRIACMLHHYTFEDATFDTTYKRALYRDGGLTLWRHSQGGSEFSITLSMAAPPMGAGELVIALEADGTCLHRLGFSWIEGKVAGVDSPALPFVAHNQGRGADSDPAFAAFEHAFPNNAPAFFCFAALQGAAQAVGMTELVGIKGSFHLASDVQSAKQLARGHDSFWQTLGGIELPGPGYLVELPFRLKPLPGNNRGRAAQRRAYWAEIGAAAHATLENRLKTRRNRAPLPLAVNA
ncbi:hypothetical protein CR103_18875 [Massilia psychrophila]|uniref:DUF535 domain-containing protein n=2 Tax=Massilia psychrophila TaxID=1603353 RepID=A0A2G8SX47_9BURK|nr:hypothetical protein CR103_18875 [Massilia psychrophila]